MRPTLVTAPTDDPLTLEDAKAHLRVDGTEEDVLIRGYIAAAVGFLQQRLHCQLLTATWRATYDAFPTWDLVRGRDGVLELPLVPAQSVTSITYLDENGVEQTWSAADYVVDIPAQSGVPPAPQMIPGRVAPAVGKSYPTAADLPAAVRVEFVAGYGAIEVTIPPEFRQILLQLVAHWHENREATISGPTIATVPLSVTEMLDSYRPLSAILA